MLKKVLLRFNAKGQKKKIMSCSTPIRTTTERTKNSSATITPWNKQLLSLNSGAKILQTFHSAKFFRSNLHLYRILKQMEWGRSEDFSMSFEPVFTPTIVGFQWNRQRKSILHFAYNDILYLFLLVGEYAEIQFIVYLQNHF